jgi:hypothetical protein
MAASVSNVRSLETPSKPVVLTSQLFMYPPFKGQLFAPPYMCEAPPLSDDHSSSVLSHMPLSFSAPVMLPTTSSMYATVATLARRSVSLMKAKRS